MKRFMQTALVLSLITYHLSLITLRADPVEDEVDKAIERGLEYLLASQRADGTYGQGAGETAAVPALAAMDVSVSPGCTVTVCSGYKTRRL